MKKFICGFVAFLMCIMSVMCVLFAQNFDNTATAVSSSKFIEDEITNKFDLVGIETKSVSNTTASKNNAPLNKETKQMMPGNVFTPNKNSAGEQRAVFSVKKFVAHEQKSIFMWLYFAEILPYDLTITFKATNEESIYWFFNNGQLLNMMDNNGMKSVPYGWRLLELKFIDAETSDGLGNIFGTEFDSMVFSYESSIEETSKTTCEGMSFYHIFMADSYDTTGIIYYQNYANYDIKEEFAHVFDGVYVGDDFKINGIYDVFEYVVIGKYDLKNYANLKDYTWSIVIRDADAKKIEIKFGETYTFEDVGWYSANIKLTKNEDTGDEVVLNTSYSFLCEQFGVGSFVKRNYFFDSGTKQRITFRFCDDFILSGDISVETGDNSVANITKYERKDGSYFVTIETGAVGKTKLTLKADGYRENGEVETYSASTTIYVNAASTDSVSITILWIVFGIFCAGLVGFIVISFVKARNFSVK